METCNEVVIKLGFPGFQGVLIKGKGRILQDPEHVVVQDGACTIAPVRTTTGRYAIVRRYCGAFGDMVAGLLPKTQKAIECSASLPEIGPYDHRQGGFFVKVFIRLPITGRHWARHVFVPCNTEQKCMPSCNTWAH